MSIGTLTSVYTGTLRLRRLYARRRRARNAAAVRVETIDVVSDDRRPRPIKQLRKRMNISLKREILHALFYLMDVVRKRNAVVFLRAPLIETV